MVYSSDTVNSMFNLSSGSMIDDAFSAINTNFNPLMANLGIVTVKLWDGTPVEGITLDGGIKDNNGNTPITDANGRAVVSTNTNEFTFSIKSLWADISDVASQSYPKTGAPTYISVTMADKGIRRLEVTSSQNIRFSNVVKTFDVFGVGGGGGAGSIGVGEATNGDLYTIVQVGYGGAGGYTQTSKGVVNTKEQITITVGHGGGGGNAVFPDDRDWNDRTIYNNGSPGGTTSVILGSSSLISAAGGEGGKAGTEMVNINGTFPPANLLPSNGGSGGGGLKLLYPTTWQGSTNGGEDGGDGAGKGQGTTTREFGEADGTLYASGGGTGARANYDNNISGRSCNGGEGAGNGIYNNALVTPTEEYTYIRGNSATTYGSGGGGIAHGEIRPGPSGRICIVGGAGKQGLVVFRWTA